MILAKKVGFAVPKLLPKSKCQNLTFSEFWHKFRFDAALAELENQ
jgi:hypothetical protein